MTKHNENNVPVGEASLLVISFENDDCKKLSAHWGKYQCSCTSRLFTIKSLSF